MINVINKECCRDCTKCNLINEVPGFDFYGCVLNQIYQKTIRIEERIDKIELREKDITIIDNEQKIKQDETSSQELP
ncbi:hypothetical protein [Phocaeicola plebeius]|uniref:hypothetical protein n=1 Tax=Phocaeicola plebeius TaxID=310297 RepID=UPI00266D4D5B|nr:hypothetical protein [Phocaeicola plebeius]